ncbi:MAG: hypothetical protein J7599_06285 [Niabella sp.]|nr:hypothetical protein [Niabella sp.]
MKQIISIKPIRRMLGMIGLAGLSLLGCSRMEYLVQPERAATQPLQALLTSAAEEMMIGIYIAPPFDFTEPVHYQRIKDANVDFIQDISGQHTPANKLAMLDMADSAGLKMIVADDRINGSDAQITAMLDTYNNHPAVIGYFIKDEPTAAQLNDAATRYGKVLGYDPSKLPHVNLFPSYATGALGSINYENDYVQQWINLAGAANLKYLSMDNYPFLSNGQFRQDPYYHDLDVIRRLGIRYGIKTSAYLQSVGVAGMYRRPNTDELRFSAYSTLAYGVKIPVWFSYWTPVSSTEVFTDAIIDLTGAKTNLYDPFRILNAELKQIGRTLIHTDAVAVYHSGTSLPAGASPIPASFMVKPVDPSANLIMTHFVNAANGKEYVMVVNKSFTTTLNATFSTGSTITNVQWISKTNGDAVATDFNPATHQFSASFLPGEGKLFPLTIALPEVTVSTLSGSGTAGYADGAAATAKFNFVTNTGMATDYLGNAYIADIDNHCIRKIDASGTVTTLAGSPGVSGNTDGTGAAARFNHPTDVAVDGYGNVYVADTWNWAVRKITPGGTVTTILGWIVPFPQGMAIDQAQQKLYLVSALPSASNGKLYELSLSGTLTTRTLDRPVTAGSIKLDNGGNLVVADNFNSVVYRVNRSNWKTEVIAGAAGQHGTADGVGANARFDHPWGLAIDAANNIYVAGCGHQFDAPTIAATASNIRMIQANSNKVITLAGSTQGYANGTGAAATFNVPTGIAVYQNQLLVLDRVNQRIRKLIK